MTGPAFGPGPLRVTDLSPNLSCAILECVEGDPAAAFRVLVAYLTEKLLEPGRTTLDIRTVGEVLLVTPDAEIEDVGTLRELRIDDLFATIHARTTQPGWANSASGVTDITNDLTLALRRNRLIALRTDVSDAALRRWTHRPSSPLRLVPPETLSATFPGDVRTAWLDGVHPRRSTKPDARMVASLRVQDLTNTVDDSTSVLRAARVSYLPPDAAAVLRGSVVTNSRSRISWATQPDLPTLFEEVVSQAVKTLRLLDNKVLVERLEQPRVSSPATWRDGQRVTGRGDFISQLRTRKSQARTEVMIVQPHVSENAVKAARAAADDGRPNHESHRLALLDLLLHGASKSVIGHGYDLTVVCSA